MRQVVPFTPSAGVLEWVNGTFPLGEYLIGRLVKYHLHKKTAFEFKKKILCVEYVDVSNPAPEMEELMDAME